MKALLPGYWRWRHGPIWRHVGLSYHGVLSFHCILASIFFFFKSWSPFAIVFLLRQGFCTSIETGFCYLGCPGWNSLHRPGCPWSCENLHVLPLWVLRPQACAVVPDLPLNSCFWGCYYECVPFCVLAHTLTGEKSRKRSPHVNWVFVKPPFMYWRSGHWRPAGATSRTFGR